jgi:heat shock protein HslJ
MRNLGRLAVLAVLATAGIAQAQEFPYDRDLVLDVRALRGSKRVPVLAIGSDGRAQIDLWCTRGQGQAAISGDAMTITVGAMNDEPCTAERQQADEDMLAALASVTSWTARGDVVTLAGARPLRFRIATN